MEPEPVFITGLLVGALLLWFVQTLIRSRRRARDSEPLKASASAGSEQSRRNEIEQLHQRLAVLERLATDPAERTAAEIERLR